LEQSGQNAFGHDFNTGLGTDLRIESHAIADVSPGRSWSVVAMRSSGPGR
jgi:hypothetical protein